VETLHTDKVVQETFKSVESPEEVSPEQHITVPPISQLQTTDSAEKNIPEENILPSSVSTESSLQPNGPEEEKPSVEGPEEEKPSVEEEIVPKVPYIVKAVPKEVPSGVPIKTEVPALDSTTTVENIKEELEPFSTEDPPTPVETDDKFLATENAVEEEPLVPANETVGESVDVIAPFSQWAEKKLEEEEKKERRNQERKGQ